MNFKVGQKVRLVNNYGMDAPVGSIARVTREPYKWTYGLLMDVMWVSKGNSLQMDGGYSANKFIPISDVNGQLQFEFMYEQ